MFLDNIVIDMHDRNAPKNFVKSLKDCGFAVLQSHPVPRELIEDVYARWKGFFNSEEKFNYLRSKIDGEGYVPQEVENAKNFHIPDLKEFYHFYLWGRYPTNIETNTTVELHNQMVSLGELLLSWIDEHTPTDIKSKFSMPLVNMVKDSDQHLLRILHYPAMSSDFASKALRSAPHEDINLLTLLPAGTSSGLQLKDNAGNWHEVPAQHLSIIVNTADMLDMCSNGYYKSVTHRVNNPIGAEAARSRYSLPFFIHPRPDVPLKEDFTAGQYLVQRLKEIGLYYDFLCIDKM